MKKIFDKILNIGCVVISVIFVAVLLVVAFGGIESAEFDNRLVRALFIALGILYAVFAAGSIVILFSDNDAVKEVLVSTEASGNTKVSKSVIKKLTKTHINSNEGIKVKKVSLSLSEYGVRIKIVIKLKNKEVEATTVYLKCLIEDVFMATLGLKFYSIDFKISSYKTDYQADKSSIEAKATEIIAEKKAEEKLEEIKTVDREILAEEKLPAVESGIPAAEEVIINELQVEEAVAETLPSETVERNDVESEKETETEAEKIIENEKENAENK